MQERVVKRERGTESRDPKTARAQREPCPYPAGTPLMWREIRWGSITEIISLTEQAPPTTLHMPRAPGPDESIFSPCLCSGISEVELDVLTGEVRRASF